MKSKTAPQPSEAVDEYYIAEEYYTSAPPKEYLFEDLYKILDISPESSDHELEGVSELMKEPESFTKREEKRKKNRFLFCNIL